MNFFSDLFKLNLRDLAKGLLVAFLGTVLTAAADSINKGTFPTDGASWLTYLKMGAGAAIIYLVKNLLTNNQDQFLTKDK